MNSIISMDHPSFDHLSIAAEPYSNTELILVNKFYEKLLKEIDIKDQVILNIVDILNRKNEREAKHSERVSELCMQIGIYLKMSFSEIKDLLICGRLHDIGKIAIDDKILNKVGDLLLVERLNVERHSEVGFKILNTVGDMSKIAYYTLFHHERWDGEGYPKRLRGEAIPLQSRIISICDAYDAITNERTYGKKLSPAEAIHEITINEATQFDPNIVKIFCKIQAINNT